MTIHEARKARLAELNTRIAGVQAEIVQRHAECGELDTQLGTASSRGSDFAALAGAKLKRDVLAREIGEWEAQLPPLEAERSRLIDQIQEHESRLRTARRKLDELRDAFSNPNVFNQGWWGGRNEVHQLHRDAVKAAMLLRAAGEDVPREITLVVSLRDFDAPRPDTAPAPVHVAEVPAEVPAAADELDEGFETVLVEDLDDEA